MADLNSDIRLAIGTGRVALGAEECMRAINGNTAKLVIMSDVGNSSLNADIEHACAIADIRLLRFKGNSMELGTVCGKPHSVSSLAVIEEGNSKILENEYKE